MLSNPGWKWNRALASARHLNEPGFLTERVFLTEAVFPTEGTLPQECFDSARRKQLAAWRQAYEMRMYERVERMSDLECGMGVSLKESLHLVSDPGNLDASVQQLFQMMLGVECQRDPEPIQIAGEAVTAVVGLGGRMSGACIVRASYPASIKMATLMIGMDFEEVDDTVNDAIGEICNVIAGAWKGKIPELASGCGLSIPTVVTGQDYQLRVHSLKFRLDHTYRFDDVEFEVSLVCHSLD